MQHTTINSTVCTIPNCKKGKETFCRTFWRETFCRALFPSLPVPEYMQLYNLSKHELINEQTTATFWSHMYQQTNAITDARQRTWWIMSIYVNTVALNLIICLQILLNKCNTKKKNILKFYLGITQHFQIYTPKCQTITAISCKANSAPSHSL